MDMKNKKITGNLTKKVSTIFGLAIAALTSNQAKAIEMPNNDFVPIEIKLDAQKVKPMPVLKLNLNDLGDSKFIASHSSHSSHRSHSSHSSHRSHYSSSFA